MSCRCGKPPEKKCAKCGRMIAAELAHCSAHPTADVDVVRCALCGLHLCGFHIQLMPRALADGTIGHTERCFPSCRSRFGAPPPREGVLQLFSARPLR